ncbi:hypothetical protein niasHS_011947 [Heterodera schachtii]|uniref:C2H2-type domain-containing protein n=1 Tax=Heterodera schachtii TaxID=97005 RepID=A0ABD2ISN6_HETSC
MDTSSQELNACAECGFTTRDWALFTRHVERHESAGGTINSRKSSKTVPTSPGAMDESVEADDGGGTDFQHLLDLALPKIEDLDNSTTNCSAEDEMIIGRLADLSRFLNANHHNRSDNSSSPVDLSSAEKRFKIENGEDEEEEHEEKIIERNCSEEPRHKTKSRSSKNNGTSGGGGAGKTTHKCPHCTFTTYMSQHMKSHLRAHENFIGQMYVCDVCGMAFSQKANMHRHRGTHSGVKPYECRFCQKRFFRKDQMQEHSMTHIKTGDDFDCPVSGCECKFSQHSLLRQHLDERHAISASQQAHCKRCTLQFANSRRLLLHYQTKHDEYYNAVSPVPDGHSPVKRLVVVNNSSTNASPASSSCGGNSGAAASSTRTRPCASSSAPTAAAPSGSASGAASANAKRRSRKRPSARRQRSNSSGDGTGGAMYPLPKVAAKMDSAANNKRRAATANPAPQNQQQSSANGYNVEELLRLNCAAANASANETKQNGVITTNQQTTVLKLSPPAASIAPSSSSCAGFDLFRDQLLRNTSIFAQQLGTAVPPPFSVLPMAHRGQQQMAAAAAHLFMQSFLMPVQQQHKNPSAIGHNQNVANKGPSNLPAEEEPHGTNISPKHLPLAKSPDCRGLVLNGFNAREEKEDMECKQEEHTTNSSCTPPMICSSNNNKMMMHDGNMEEEGSESESGGGVSILDSKKQAEEMVNINKVQQKSSMGEGHLSSSAIITAPPALPNATSSSSSALLSAPTAARHGTNNSSAHSSTTHSPSSSSSSTSSSSCAASSHAVVIIGGESSASSTGAMNGTGAGGASTSVENSPIKDLNNKLLSRALMNASVSSTCPSNADNGTGGGGGGDLLLKGLMMLEPSSAIGTAGGDSMDCAHCGLIFTDQTLYLLHKGLHSEADPWRCNLCGQSCSDKYTFTTHMISSDHS